MAMVRLPTQASRGRANLHQGAVAAGIELHSGRTLGGVCQSRIIDVHPDTRQPIQGLVIPYWTQLLGAAVRLATHLEMGYVGIDFVLDENRGPIVLEANARPGLAIQLANRTGLLHRLYRHRCPTGRRGLPHLVGADSRTGTGPGGTHCRARDRGVRASTARPTRRGHRVLGR